MPTYRAVADPTWWRPVQSCINGNHAYGACHVQKIPCLTLSRECAVGKTDFPHFIEESSITVGLTLSFMKPEIRGVSTLKCKMRFKLYMAVDDSHDLSPFILLLSFCTCFRCLCVFELLRRAVNFYFEIAAFILTLRVHCAVVGSERKNMRR